MTALFGRAVELEAITSHLHRRRREHGVGVVVIEGAPGAGKSRLLTEVRARLRFAHPIVVGAAPGGEGPPVSAALLSGLEAAVARDPEVAALPSLGEMVSWPATLEAANLLRGRTGDLAILIDDVQWCDPRSGPLLAYLARSARLEQAGLTLVLAGRSSPVTSALTATLAAAAPDDVVVVEVGGLDAADAESLVAATNPTLDPDEVAAVAARAAGMPIWCVLLARGGPDPSELPRIVSGRLAAATDGAMALATTLAVLGGPCHVDDLCEIHRWRRHQTLATLGELDQVGLITWETTAHVGVHHLLRDAVAEHVGDTRWRRAHRAIARWLEARADGDAPLLLAACGHRCRAGMDPRDLVLAIVNAPTRRLIGHDGLDVLHRLLEQPGSPLGDDLAVRGGLARLAGELARHSSALEGWRYVAERSADPDARAAAWVAACIEAQHLEDLAEASSCLERGRTAARDSADVLLQVEVDLAGAAMELWLERHIAAAQQLTARSLGALEALRPEEGWSAAPPRVRRAQLRALTLVSLGAQQRGDTEEVLRVADEIAEVAAGFEVEAFIDSELRSGSALMLAGRLPEARRRLRSAYAEAGRALLAEKRLDVGSWLLWTTTLMGELDEAASVADECQALIARLEERSRPASLVALYASDLEMSRADRDLAFARLDQLLERETDPHFRIGIRRVQALWSARLGTTDAGAVVGVLRSARHDADVAACHRCSAELVLVGIEALTRVGAIEVAADWLDGVVDDGSGGSTLHAWRNLRARACLAAAQRSNEAQELLAAAVERAEEIGLCLEAVWARLDLAGLLAAGDAAAAVAVLEPALVWSSAHGATTERRRIEQTLRALGQRTWTRGRTAHGEGLSSLSERELEVAQHIVGGLSNLQIAERMFLSVKTIERHVSSALAKTGARNRVELAALVASARAAGSVGPAGRD